VLVRAALRIFWANPAMMYVVEHAATQDHGARWPRLHRLVRLPLPPLQGNQCPTTNTYFGWKANAALEILNCDQG